jgi:hypothetical protein
MCWRFGDKSTNSVRDLETNLSTGLDMWRQIYPQGKRYGDKFINRVGDLETNLSTQVMT